MTEKKEHIDLSFIDLFCGAGGFSEGFKQAGYTPLLGFEKCRQAGDTYTYNIGAPCIIDDICKYPPENILDNIGLKPGELDLVIGGPPCQGFSLAGKMDVNDERNKLYKEFVNVVSYIKPKVIIMENVPAIENHNDGKTLDAIQNDFKNVGYSLKFQKLNAINYGVPQTRERIFFVGSLKGQVSFPPPKSHYYSKNGNIQGDEKGLQKFVNVYQAINDLLLEGDIGEDEQPYKHVARSNYQKARKGDNTILYNHKGSNHTPTVVERFSFFKEGDSIKDIKELSGKHKTNKMIAKRLHKEQPSPTVTTLPDDIIHYSENRILTVREMARLQSFDDSFKFLGKRTTGGNLRKYECPQYTLVGNSVPPLLSKAIAEELKNSSAFKI